ncbi:hypothetical protein DRQ09_05305, partial [candidate division KSB1 bacterium]
FISKVNGNITSLKIIEYIMNGPYHHFSQNGNYIVFASRKTGNYDIYLLKTKDVENIFNTRKLN